MNTNSDKLKASNLVFHVASNHDKSQPELRTHFLFFQYWVFPIEWKIIRLILLSERYVWGGCIRIYSILLYFMTYDHLTDAGCSMWTVDWLFARSPIIIPQLCWDKWNGKENIPTPETLPRKLPPSTKKWLVFHSQIGVSIPFWLFGHHFRPNFCE